MKPHLKTHKKFQCDQCGKSFKYLELLTKHTKIDHENCKLYCHYFNNKKVCPFIEECLFLHEEAEICKYGKQCERILCMFKHEYEDDENLSDEVKNDEKDDVDNIVSNVIEVIEGEKNGTEDVPCENENIIDVQDDIEHEDDTSNATFMNPSQIDKLLSDNMFKCEICDFTSSSKICIIDHKEAIHNWCPTCYSSFMSQDI